MIIDNQKYSTQYFSINEERFVDANQKICASSFNEESYTAHLANEMLPPIHLNEYKPVLPGIYPIPPRTKWSFQNGVFNKLKSNVKYVKNIDLNSCMRMANHLIKVAKGPIAIELSGGLDSSIMIGVFEKLGYEPILIGTISNLYKFRTERYIQENIARKFKHVVFSDSYSKQFEDLINTPTHFLPHFLSLYHAVGSNTINLLNKHKIQYILEGTGFDEILVRPSINDINCFRYPSLQGSWFHDYVFQPQGYSYVDVTSIPSIKQTILSLRRGEAEDTQKWWARRFFANILPPELSHYAYKANFGPLWADGLKSNAEQIDHIIQVARMVSPLPIFRAFNAQTILEAMNSGKLSRELFCPLSYANWIHSLHRVDRIAY